MKIIINTKKIINRENQKNYHYHIKSFIYNMINNKTAYEQTHKNFRRLMSFSRIFEINPTSYSFEVSGSKEFLGELRNSLLRRDNLYFFGVPVQSVKIILEKKKYNSKTCFTLSPITYYEMEGKESIFYDIEDPLFKEKIINNIKAKYNRIYGKQIEDFDIVFSNTRMVKKERYAKRGFLFLYKKCFYCDIEIKGSEDVINFISMYGIGRNTGLGFGMLTRN